MSDRPVALVTGAARRLGRHIALDLAANGWDVAVHYHRSAADAASTVADARAAGAQAHGFGADLADEAACLALLPDVARRFGRIDAVVNNASLFEHDTVADFSYVAMDRHWRANTGPAVLLARALHGAGGGVVVNLLDQKLWNPNPDHFSYTLSKAALETATTLLAQALAPSTRVCAVAPGLTLNSDRIGDEALRLLQSQTPLERGVTPDAVAQTVRFLLGNASITGTTVLVDAGTHLRPSARDFAFQTP